MKQILIIEDDGALQMIYKEALEPEGFVIHGAVTAKEGWDQTKSLKPDLILLDIMLPGGMNGFDLMEQIKQDPELKTIPILILTNLDSEKTTGMTMGAVDYIVKANTSISEVVAKVKAILPN